MTFEPFRVILDSFGESLFMTFESFWVILDCFGGSLFMTFETFWVILDSFGGLLFMTFARFFGGGVRKEALDIFRFSSGTPPLPKRSFQRLASSKISPLRGVLFFSGEIQISKRGLIFFRWNPKKSLFTWIYPLKIAFFSWRFAPILPCKPKNIEKDKIR